jgi:hypothetical protein
MSHFGGLRCAFNSAVNEKVLLMRTYPPYLLRLNQHPRPQIHQIKQFGHV